MGAVRTQLFPPSAAILRSVATLRHLGKEHLANSIRQQTFSPTALIVRKPSENLQAVFLLSVNARSRFCKTIAVGLKTGAHFHKSKYKHNSQNEFIVYTGTKNETVQNFHYYIKKSPCENPGSDSYSWATVLESSFPHLWQVSWPLQSVSLPGFFSDGPLLLCINKQARKVTVLIWRAVQGLETFVPHIQVSALTHWPPSFDLSLICI